MTNKTKPMDTFTIILLIFIGLGSIAGFIYTIKKFFKAERAKSEIIKSQNERIDSLESNLDSANSEIKIKSDSIEELTIKVLDFSEKIENNTKTLSGLAKKISNVTEKTNSIAKNIENEQKQKGKVILERPDSITFLMTLGNNFFSPKPEDFERGVSLKNYFDIELDIEVKFSDQDVLVSSIIYDKNYERVIELIEGKWAINKTSVFSLNYDNRAIEIIGNTGIVLFQLEFKENEIKFQGVTFNLEGAVILCDNGIIKIPYDSPLFEHEYRFYALLSTKRIFEHTGADYLGKRTPENLKEQEEKQELKLIVAKEANLYFKNISDEELIEQSKYIITKLTSLSNENIEKQNLLIKEKKLIEAASINKQVITLYHKSIRTEAIKLKNTLLKRTKYADYNNEFNVAFETPRYFAPDFSTIVDKLDKMIKILKTNKE